MSRLRLCSVVLMPKVRLLLLRVRLAVSDVRSVRRLVRMGQLRLIISVRILIIVSVRIAELVKRFVRDILFSNGRKNCCVKAWRFFFSIKGCEYMFALWGGMWYDESEVMNFVVICSDAMLERIAVGRRMYHDCVCSWNDCGYD